MKVTAAAAALAFAVGLALVGSTAASAHPPVRGPACTGTARPGAGCRARITEPV